MNLDELRDCFHSEDLTRIDEGIAWLLQSGDAALYSDCLKGWTTKSSGEDVKLKLDSELLGGEESVIKEDGWRSGYGSYTVLRLLENPMEGAELDPSLDLSSLTEVGIPGVQCTSLPGALTQCTSLRKLNLDDCEAIETLDDVRLVHAVIRNDAKWVAEAIDKIKAPFTEVAACFEAELDALPRVYAPDSAQNASDSERFIAIQEWKQKNRSAPQLILGLTLFQVKHNEETPNEATQQILDFFTENAAEMALDSVPEVSVDEVQVAPIVAHLIHGLKQDAESPRAESVHPGGDWDQWYFSFLARVSALNPYWFMALLYDLPISGAISVWGGEVWCPKIMYNGNVIIRNHHRVIVPDYIGTVALNDADVRTFLADLDRFTQEFVMAVGTVDGEVTLHVKPSQLRDEAIRSGNNFITILHNDETVAELHPAIQSWIASVYENTRSGMMLRVVPGGISFYRTYRGDDSFDYALENLDWIMFNQGEITEEYPSGYRIEESPWSYSGITYQEEAKAHEAYVYKMLPERLEYDMLDGFESPEMAQVNPFGVSSMDVLYSEFTAFMLKEARNNWPYTPKIFSKNTEYPLGYEDYGKKKMDFIKANGFNTVFTVPAGYEMAEHSMDLFSDLVGMVVGRLESTLFELNFKMESLSEPSADSSKLLNPWGDIAIFTEANTMAVLTFPHACHSERRDQIDGHFGDRVLDVNKDEESANLSVRLNLNIGESGTTIDAADVDFLRGIFEDYVESYCEGDWSCFADEFWHFIQIYTRMPDGLFFEMEELGKAFTSIDDYDWFAEETSGLIGPGLNIALPFAGTSQGFDSGDMDSGNM